MKLPRFTGSFGARFVLLLVFYSAGLSLARWLAYQLRFDFHVEPPFQHQFYLHWVWVVPMKLVLLYAFGQFSGLLSYFSVPDLRRLFYATTLASGLLLFTYYFSGGFYRPPRGVILIDYVLSFLFVATSRLSFRLVRERYLTPEGHASRRARRVGIVGAGDAGAALARDLTIKRGLGLQPVVFFDDNRSKWRSRVHDILVVGPPEALLDSKLDLQLEEIIIAMPSAPPKRVGEIVKLCQRARLKFGTVPSLDQLATGKVKVSQLRNVEIQDLLGREPVQLEKESIRQILAGRVVLVTGAGGSIGSELCRQIVQYNPKRLLLVEQSEGQAFEIEQELIGGGYGAMILPLVADILDPARMRYIFQRFTPELVFHAAAHKHVPMMESQPSEAIKNNTFGTAQVADLALEFNIERFVFISTDKAINPTNTMGATKRLAEMFVQALAAREPQRTKFMAVRFGNVLGSSGSVIPIFNKQIAAGGPVRVTHPDVTRYFMTIPEAVGLVLQSATQGQGGEIFVLDMGKPVKIVDLARQLIELSGLRPDEDIAIEFTGLRPGEKLFEEINHRGENIAPTNHPKILRFVCKPLPLDEVRGHLQRLAGQLHDLEPNQLKLQLKEAVPEYQPFLT